MMAGSDAREVTIGVDIGTTSARALVTDLAGAVLALRAVPYPLSNPRPGYAEQDVDAVLDAAESAVRDAVEAASPARVQALALSTYLHGLVALDRRGAPLMPVLTWADSRAEADAQAIAATAGGVPPHLSPAGLDVYRRSGCPLHPMYPLAKLRWLKRAQPDTFRRAARFGSTKECVIARWTGQVAVDRSVASATGLFDLERRDWADDLLDLAGVGRDRLAEAVSPYAHWPLSGEPARRMGLPAGLPVVAGAGDGPLSQVASGGSPGVAVAMIGTSGAVRMLSDRPRLDAAARTWCYLLDDRRFVVGGAIHNGGIVLRWIRDQFGAAEVESARRAGRDPYDVLTEQAAGVAPGADGLLFLPFLAGERSPGWNAAARGVLFGLSLHHTRAHLVRAALEGVALRLATVYRALVEVAGPPRLVRASGGFTRSSLWVQILADALGVPVEAPVEREASALGAALLAQIALGARRGWDDLPPELGRAAASYEPHPDRHELYTRTLEAFLGLYRDLTPWFPPRPALSAADA